MNEAAHIERSRATLSHQTEEVAIMKWATMLTALVGALIAIVVIAGFLALDNRCCTSTAKAEKTPPLQLLYPSRTTQRVMFSNSGAGGLDESVSEGNEFLRMPERGFPVGKQDVGRHL